MNPIVRSALLGGAFVLVAAAPVPARAEEAGIHFEELSFDAALARARAESKPLIVDVYATWCSPCKEMEEKVFPRAEVGAAARPYLALRIDAEKGEGPAVYKRYHVTGYPTLLFLTPEGEEIDRVFGSVPPDELVRALDGFRAAKGTLADLSDALAAAGAKADVAMIYEVGYRHALRGETPAAEKLLGRVEKMDPDNAAGWASKSLYALAAWLYNPSEDWARAAKTFAKLMARYPESEEAKGALKPLAKAYLKMGRSKDVRATLDRLIAGETAKSKPYNVYAWFCFQNKFDLARGVEVATKGLAIDSKDAGLWDTLAELHYAMGHGADAVAATKKAIELEPADAYFKTQLARFSAPPPAGPAALAGGK
jgi:thioredoxin-like negative regulator of GroEL